MDRRAAECWRGEALPVKRATFGIAPFLRMPVLRFPSRGPWNNRHFPCTRRGVLAASARIPRETLGRHQRLSSTRPAPRCEHRGDFMWPRHHPSPPSTSPPPRPPAEYYHPGRWRGEPASLWQLNRHGRVLAPYSTSQVRSGGVRRFCRHTAHILSPVPLRSAISPSYSTS